MADVGTVFCGSVPGGKVMGIRVIWLGDILEVVCLGGSPLLYFLERADERS